MASSIANDCNSFLNASISGRAFRISLLVVSFRRARTTMGAGAPKAQAPAEAASALFSIPCFCSSGLYSEIMR